MPAFALLQICQHHQCLFRLLRLRRTPPLIRNSLERILLTSDFLRPGKIGTSSFFSRVLIAIPFFRAELCGSVSSSPCYCFENYMFCRYSVCTGCGNPGVACRCVREAGHAPRHSTSSSRSAQHHGIQERSGSGQNAVMSPPSAQRSPPASGNGGTRITLRLRRDRLEEGDDDNDDLADLGEAVQGLLADQIIHSGSRDAVQGAQVRFIHRDHDSLGSNGHEAQVAAAGPTRESVEHQTGMRYKCFHKETCVNEPASTYTHTHIQTCAPPKKNLRKNVNIHVCMYLFADSLR
jgi:hypothetical protein